MPKTLRLTPALLSISLTLALGTPGYLAYADPGLRGYLLHPVLFIAQAAPFGLAAFLWRPGRLRLPATGPLVLACLLLLSAIALYLPMLTGLTPMGGDMIAITFIATAIGTTLGVLLGTVIAVGVAVLRQRPQGPM